MKIIKLKEQLQWTGFIAALTLFAAPITAISVFFTIHPEYSSTPVFLAVFTCSVILSAVYLVLRKNGRILEIDGHRWTLVHENTAKVLKQFDLSLPHSFAAAIRQGLTGKNSKTMNRWVQLFLVQNSESIKIESAYLESLNLKGIDALEWCRQIKEPQNDILKDLAAKPFTYDETEYLKGASKPGSSVYGLPSYYKLDETDTLPEIANSAWSASSANTFLASAGNYMAPGKKFREFKKGFFHK